VFSTAALVRLSVMRVNDAARLVVWGCKQESGHCLQYRAYKHTYCC